MSSDHRGLAALVRLYWCFLGPATLFFAAVLIALRKSFYVGWLDLLFWAATAALVILRHVDIFRFDGTTGYGEPATRQDYRQYVTRLVPAAVVIWAAAQAAAAYL